MNNTDLMKEKTDLIKKINHLYQYPGLDANSREEVNKRLREVAELLLNLMNQGA